MKIIEERDTTTIRQTVIFSASPEQVYEVLMDSEKHESLSGEKANISREVGAPSRRGESIFPGSTWCFSPVGELSRLGAPMIGGPITIQSSRLTYAHWMVARSFASRRSACRPTDSMVILADGSKRTGNQCRNSVTGGLLVTKRVAQVRRLGNELIKEISEGSIWRP